MVLVNRLTRSACRCRLRDGLPTDVWAVMAPAPPTLHLRINRIKVPPAVARTGGGGGTITARVDVMAAYGDLECKCSA